MEVINELCPAWRDLAIHESSPGGPLSDKLRQECPGYCASHYFPDVELGLNHRGFRCEDLARQTFAAESFDIVVTSDVLEHLPETKEAMIDVARTLKRGGAHIFTVPWYKTKETIVRARLIDGEIVHLEPPDFHGNPVSEEGSLVVTEWGRELPFLLAEWVNLPVSIFHFQDRSRGLEGEFLEVFAFRKP